MKRLIYTLCLIIGCATLSEAKVLTGHKTRQPTTGCICGETSAISGKQCVPPLPAVRNAFPYGRLSPCPIASMPQMP